MKIPPLLLVDVVVLFFCVYILHLVLAKTMGAQSAWPAGAIVLCSATYAKFERWRYRKEH